MNEIINVKNNKKIIKNVLLASILTILDLILLAFLIINIDLGQGEFNEFFVFMGWLMVHIPLIAIWQLGVFMKQWGAIKEGENND